MSTSQINVQFNGVTFKLPETNLRKTDWSGNPTTPYISLSAKTVASILKQYVKQKFPTVTVSAESDTYSGGDSVRVYLSTEDGNPVDSSIQKDVNTFSKQFEEGSFNGMIDMYEYSYEELVTDNGTPIKGGAKYIFIENRPKFGTVADTVRMLRDYQLGNYIGGIRNLKDSITEVMRYGITQSTVDKALKLL
jgi:hypothetical protein